MLLIFTNINTYTVCLKKSDLKKAEKTTTQGSEKYIFWNLQILEQYVCRSRGLVKLQAYTLQLY